MSSKYLILVKEKKHKCVYVEDLYLNTFKNHILVSSLNGLNFLNVSFPNVKFLNSFCFYGPLHVNFRISAFIIIKQVKLFLKGLSQGFFLEFRMVGLGFKIKRGGNFLSRNVKFDIGFSHLTKLSFSPLIKLCRIKRRFLLFSVDYSSIKILLKQIQNLRKHNPYKMRGLKLTGGKFRVKAGKKQTKR